MAVLPQTHNTIPSPTTPKSCQQVCTLFWCSPKNYLVMQEFVRSWPIFEFSIRFHRTFVNCWISGTIKKQNKKRVLLKTDSKCNARWNALHWEEENVSCNWTDIKLYLVYFINLSTHLHWTSAPMLWYCLDFILNQVSHSKKWVATPINQICCKRWCWRCK